MIDGFQMNIYQSSISSNMKKKKNKKVL